jgi:hypothetical protein
MQEFILRQQVQTAPEVHLATNAISTRDYSSESDEADGQSRSLTDTEGGD